MSGGDSAAAAAAPAGAAAVVPKPGSHTCVINHGRKKVHCILTDDSELVEEYDVITDELLCRKVRRKTALGGEGKWEYEVGQDPHVFNADSDLLAPASQNPTLLRKDSRDAFVWRIRNLTWPKDVYSVEPDLATQEVVVRTSNRKYFKRIAVPDMLRQRLPLRPEHLTWRHENNTLIISYRKPAAILQREEEERRARAQMQGQRLDESECKTQ